MLRSILMLLTACLVTLSNPAIADDRIAPDKLPNAVSHCESGGEMVACYLLARHYFSFPEGSRDAAKIQRYSAMGCQIVPHAGDDHDFQQYIGGQSCSLLGSQLRNGSSGAADLAGSTNAYRKGCDFGSLASCAFLGEAYKDGRGVTRDEAKAMIAYRKACSAGMPVACYQPAKMLFLKGLAAPEAEAQSNPDYAFARAAASTACKVDWIGQSQSCWYSGLYMNSGIGGPQAYDEALPDLTKSCDLTDKPEYCYSLAVALLKASPNLRDTTKADSLLRQACAKEYAPACQAAERRRHQ